VVARADILPSWVGFEEIVRNGKYVHARHVFR